jgi:hypothetical protein
LSLPKLSSAEEVIFLINPVVKGLRRLLPLMSYTKYAVAAIALVSTVIEIDHGSGSALPLTLIFTQYLRLVEFAR